MKKIKNIILSLTIVGFLGGIAFSTVPQNTYAAGSGGCTNSFLGFPAWYRGLIDENTCELNPVTDVGSFIFTIGFNVIDIALRLVGYVCVAFILYGGFTFIVGKDGTGSSETVVKARKTILNAVIGLVISIVAVAIVNFIFKGLFGA